MDLFKDEQRISVTILTGFLGSGKTTFLNYLIKNCGDKKIFVIENEFGEISIDSELITRQNEGIFELSNGCLCCTLNDDLQKTLQKVAFHPAKPTHLVIETTGLADPAPVALSFISDLNVQSLFRLDSIITLADAVNFDTTAKNETIVAKQLAIADMVLLTKTDVASTEACQWVADEVAKINPFAHIIPNTEQHLATIHWLDLRAFSAEKVVQTDFSEKKPKKFTLAGTKSNVSAFAPAKLSHLNDVQSHSFVLDVPFDVLKFDAWIRVMLNWGNGLFYRGKGILYIEGMDRKVVFQSVQNQFVTEDGGEWAQETKQTKLVFIGKHLDKDLLHKGLLSCTVNGIDAYEEAFFESIMGVQDQMYEQLKHKLETR